MTQEQQHQVEDLNDQMLVRRQKMEQLREDGIDPLEKDLNAHTTQKNCMNYLIQEQKKN